MTEPAAEYSITVPEDKGSPQVSQPAALTVVAAVIGDDEGYRTDPLVAYFERRRDALIAELRELDRFLGREQTIPVRRR